MKLIKNFPDNRTKVYQQDGEYIVRFFDADGRHLPDADYFTDDKTDALATASVRWMNLGD